MFAVKHITDAKGNVLIQDPPIAQFLFQNTKASIIWLLVRLYVAYDFLEAGWHKFNDPAWMGDGSGILGRDMGRKPSAVAFRSERASGDLCRADRYGGRHPMGPQIVRASCCQRL